MSTISKLPEELERRLPYIRDEWIRIGLSTEPADREMAEKGADLAYTLAGLQPPKSKIWFSSPLKGLTEAGNLRTKKRALNVLNVTKILTLIENQFWSGIRGPVEFKVQEPVETLVIHLVQDLITEQIWQTEYQTWREVEELNNCGSAGIAWLAFCKVFEDLMDDVKKLEGHWLLAQNCGWWWAFEDTVILTERPNKLIRDETGRLHCEDGPALTYPDGFSIYSWHGYKIPDTHHWIITDKSKLTPDIIDAEPNAELRRIMLEIHGFENYLNQRPHIVLDEDINLGQPRRLLETQVGDETVKILDVTNGSDEPDGSRRRFFLGAMAGATTVHEAVALSYGIDPEYYREGVRT